MATAWLDREGGALYSRAGEAKQKRNMGQAARAHLESLLRTRNLDVTLTSPAPWQTTPRDPAPTGVTRSTWRSAADGLAATCPSLSACARRDAPRFFRALAAAAARGEAVALIDTHDRFDPQSADAAGLDLSKLLWVRESGDAARALKAANLVLQAGGFRPRRVRPGRRAGPHGARSFRTRRGCASRA